MIRTKPIPITDFCSNCGHHVIVHVKRATVGHVCRIDTLQPNKILRKFCDCKQFIPHEPTAD